MEIKLLNGTRYAVVDVKNTNGILGITFNDKTPQDLERIFKDKMQLGVIEVYDNAILVSKLDGFVVYCGQSFCDGNSTVLLTHEVDLSEQRITQAVANAQIAVNTSQTAIDTANSVNASVTEVDSKVDYVAMIANIDVTLIQ